MSKQTMTLEGLIAEFRGSEKKHEVGVPPLLPEKKLTKKGRQEQAARVKRFLALPPQLQEGILRYGENIQKAYSEHIT